MKRLISILLIVLLCLTAFSTVAFAAVIDLPFTYHSSEANISFDEQTSTLLFTLNENVSQTTVFLQPKYGVTIQVYADVAKTQPVELKTDLGILTVTLGQKDTYLYLTATDDDETTEYTLCFVSPRAVIKYRDSINISDWAFPYMSFCNDAGMGIIHGDENGNALPRNNLSRHEIAAVAARFLGLDCSKFNVDNAPFEDSLAPWAKSSVCALNQLGIINGHKDGKYYYYRGNDNVTRQEVAIIMVNILLYAQRSSQTAEEIYTSEKETFEQCLSGFADEIYISEWARPYMALAIKHFGFLSGSKEEGKLYLHPKRHITREEMTAIVARELGFDIDLLMNDLLTQVKKKLNNLKKVPAALRTPLTDAYNHAVSAQKGTNVGKKNAAYSKLYLINDLMLHPRLVYLSPSNQMANAYTGPNTNEGAQMQAVAALLKPMLEDMGFSVFIADVKTPLDQRAVEAKKMKADIYVAIHSNATGIKNNGSWQGSIIFHSDNLGSQRLAASVDKYLSALTPTVDKGIINDSKTKLPYKEIRLPEMANILAEVEYHDYAPYANWIINNKPKLAEAFASGILKYFLWY
ncbi:MAG: S-layer homology domain-containing protein [Clostridia bacterium]|nr:S-layer homology domain-containing protein [Clostridia bacterium]